MKDHPREFDIVVTGATGFTGSLVTEYLCERYGVDGRLRWAAAGRNKQKLAALRDSLGAAAADLPLIVADSLDAESMRSLAKRTRVVLTTVGPYARYGSELVAACAENGTHYCDLAGEVQWIRRMIDAHDETARESGARIVHCCGFDSIPMDIGAWFLQNEARARCGEYCESITLLVKAMKGGASGGTMASMMNLMREARADREVARVLARPYSLNPEGEQRGPDGGDQRGIRFDADARSWTAPFIMASVNTRVVRRSHALLGYPWGAAFRYHEAIRTGPGAAGWFRAAMITAGLTGLVGLASFGWSRSLLERFVLPKPGTGPDAQAREDGFFDLRQTGTLADGRRIRSRITGDRDPGYGSTSRMLAESAVCLALDDLDAAGGVLTPASTMAAPLIERLQANAGLTFEICD
ncbi:MAG TPA: saccharopine dehydrogenase NADP-binding domain-containing protein [Woeseiaceae bacterium]|nr:saccharopine dehydrogenase NADP-binding domain-containing protein [Woeseiaceae bacterium]